MATTPATVQEIEQAIGKLTTEELQELYSWLEQNHPQPIDARVASGLENGSFDASIFRALDDEKSGRIRQL